MAKILFRFQENSFLVLKKSRTLFRMSEMPLERKWVYDCMQSFLESSDSKSRAISNVKSIFF